jgi:DNA polymerase-3 subunit epsilon
MRQLILDTETTGFDPKEGHRIVEFAALELVDRKLTGNYLHLYINPLRDIPIEATNIHGITNQKVSSEPSFDKLAQKIIDFIAGSDLIIHNAKFDVNFLDYELQMYNYQPTNQYINGVIDTLQMARAKFPGSKNSLDALCDRFKINRKNRTYHGALIDCELLYDVYLNLTRQQYTLLENEINNDIYQGLNIDIGQYNLQEVNISDETLQLHNKIISDINKLSNGKCIWQEIDNNG